MRYLIALALAAGIAAPAVAEDVKVGITTDVASVTIESGGRGHRNLSFSG